MTVVDIHTHLIPRFVLDEAASRGVFGMFERDGWLVHPQGFRYPVTTGLIEAGAKLAQMDFQRIDVSVVSCSPTLYFYDAPADEALEFTQRCNNSLSALTNSRLAGLATLPLQAPEAAAEELERSVLELGLKGAQIGTDCESRPLDAPEFEPVLATAEELGVPLFLHPYYVGPKPALEDFYMTNTVGNPLSTCLAAARLIHSGTLRRLPRLKIVLAHGGGYLPYQLGRLDHAFGVRAEPRAAIDQAPSGFVRRFWFDTITYREDALGFLSQLVGLDRLVLGTDLPFDMADLEAVARLERAGIDPHALGRTASELFALP